VMLISQVNKVSPFFSFHYSILPLLGETIPGFAPDFLLVC
jgi:hypothetical protein